jgi:hypothetical protein
MRKILLTTAFIFASFVAQAQYGDRDSNRIGISVGANQFTMNTTDFDTSPGTGWNAGLSVRGNFYNDFDMVYGIAFSENQFTVKTTSPVLEDVKCKIQSAQISLLLSYKIVENHLSVEAGPMFQFNGKLDVKEEDEATPIDLNGTVIKDIMEIPVFNFYPTVGVTAGVRHVRLHLFYQYGVTNMFRGLDKPTGEGITGHGSILGGNLCFYL